MHDCSGAGEETGSLSSCACNIAALGTTQPQHQLLATTTTAGQLPACSPGSLNRGAAGKAAARIRKLVAPRKPLEAWQLGRQEHKRQATKEGHRRAPLSDGWRLQEEQAWRGTLVGRLGECRWTQDQRGKSR